MYFNGSIGRITDYIKTAQLEQKWQQKKIISTAKLKDFNRVSKFLNPNDDGLKAKRMEDIKNKMKSGKRLSHDEKAMKIEKERDEFRRALTNCKTEEEVMRLKISKSLELQAEIQAMSGHSKDTKDQVDYEFMGMRMMAIFDEFTDFIKSDEYADILNEYEKNDRESENMERSGKYGKSKFKKVKLTLNEEIAFNGYKLNEVKILSKAKFFEPAKPAKPDSIP